MQPNKLPTSFLPDQIAKLKQEGIKSSNDLWVYVDNHGIDGLARLLCIDKDLCGVLLSWQVLEEYKTASFAGRHAEALRHDHKQKGRFLRAKLPTRIWQSFTHNWLEIAVFLLLMIPTVNILADMHINQQVFIANQTLPPYHILTDQDFHPKTQRFIFGKQAVPEEIQGHYTNQVIRKGKVIKLSDFSEDPVSENWVSGLDYSVLTVQVINLNNFLLRKGEDVTLVLSPGKANSDQGDQIQALALDKKLENDQYWLIVAVKNNDLSKLRDAVSNSSIMVIRSYK